MFKEKKRGGILRKICWKMYCIKINEGKGEGIKEMCEI
jgi:hypothetical protein